jgi:hypothetical protein
MARQLTICRQCDRVVFAGKDYDDADAYVVLDNKRTMHASCYEEWKDQLAERAKAEKQEWVEAKHIAHPLSVAAKRLPSPGAFNFAWHCGQGLEVNKRVSTSGRRRNIFLDIPL